MNQDKILELLSEIRDLQQVNNELLAEIRDGKVTSPDSERSLESQAIDRLFSHKGEITAIAESIGCSRVHLGRRKYFPKFHQLRDVMLSSPVTPGEIRRGSKSDGTVEAWDYDEFDEV